MIKFTVQYENSEVPVMSSKFNMLKLENQLCFPLYAASKELIRRYKPFLDPLDLTYTQYYYFDGAVGSRFHQCKGAG